MIEHLKTFGKTHLFYIILIAIGLIAFRTWLGEHDARLAADAKIKENQATITGLQQQMAARDAQAQQQKAQIIHTVAAVKTPAQVVQAVPQLTDIPLGARIAPSLQPTEVAVQALPLMQLVGEYKQLSIDNATCQADLTDQKKITAADEDTIKQLKAKPKFWARVKSHGAWMVGGMILLEGARIYLGGRL